MSSVAVSVRVTESVSVSVSVSVTVRELELGLGVDELTTELVELELLGILVSVLGFPLELEDDSEDEVEVTLLVRLVTEVTDDA
jgi:hypothetical protein